MSLRPPSPKFQIAVDGAERKAVGARLDLLSKKLDNDVTNQSGNDSDGEICGGEDISDAESQAFSLTICKSKFPHEKVGIEQEDYEANLDHRPPYRGQFSGLFIIGSHRR
jgi:hypothetical protein